ncbi:Aldehyde dehydrogenase 3 member H1 [Castilleja foliolosa]|uniref:Aldehyde dehydrogenase 3 member H1 n=1 Tax=Castilleja foliolosa TaxID=1961234 RepID=A0ABD3DR21_9LAMI
MVYWKEGALLDTIIGPGALLLTIDLRAVGDGLERGNSREIIRLQVKTSITTFPSSGEIVSEPLGVVLIISTWNYPFLLSLDPVIGAIAAGNAVVLKPSEVAPATSSILSKLLGDYMDTSAIKVVEGGSQETTALLEQKWDKIFYTGNSKVGRIILAAAAKHLTPVILELGGKCGCESLFLVISMGRV